VNFRVRKWNARLCISERTVENHLQRVYAKLAVHRRAELIARIVSGYELP
jgi:DNA-binding CsgD family transcriptional regulator